MQSARTITLEYVLFKLRPFEVLSCIPLKFVISSSVTKLCPLYNFKTVQDVFMKLNTSINQH